MSLLSRELARGMREAERAVRASFNWAGNDYPLVPTSATRRKDLGIGGFQLDADFKFTVRLDVLPAPGPQLKQTLVYLGEAYRIDKIEKLAGGTLLRFWCNEPNQGA